MSKELLIDFIGSEIKFNEDLLNESIKQNNGDIIIRNVLLTETDKPNSNKRVYPHEYFQREFSLYENNMINLSRAIMELDHPTDRTEFWAKEGCAQIINGRWKGNELYGDIKVLKFTPNGKMLEGYLKNGTILGVSSRAVGSTMYFEGINRVQDDLILLGFDIVSNPSVVSSTFNQGGGYRIDESKLFETMNKMKFDKDYIKEKKLKSFLCRYKNICNL